MHNIKIGSVLTCRHSRHLPRAHSNSPEAREQPGYSLLCHELVTELVQRQVALCHNTEDLAWSIHLHFRNVAKYCAQNTRSEQSDLHFVGDDPRRDMHPVVTAMFGATAGAASVFGNTPLDVVKTRMQVMSTVGQVCSRFWHSEDDNAVFLTALAKISLSCTSHRLQAVLGLRNCVAIFPWVIWLIMLLWRITGSV